MTSASEFFNRETQTRDSSSNRYDQTCKKCGKLLVKGRVETLLNHLLKKCSGLSQDERKRVKAATESKDPTAAQRAIVENSRGVVDPAVMSEASPMLEQTLMQSPEPDQQGGLKGAEMTDVPDTKAGIAVATAEDDKSAATVALSRTQSALDTLAEASSQHLEQSTQKPDETDEDRSQTGDVYHNNFIAQLQTATKSAQVGIETTREGEAYLSQFRPLASPPPSLVAYSVPTPTELPVPEWQDYDSTLAAALTTRKPLARTATTARKRTWEEVEHPTDGSDDLSQNAETSTSATMPTAPSTIPPEPEALVPLNHGQFFHNLNPTMYLPDGTVERPIKATIRTRFTDARRQEVLKVRKQGACIRCRMLKKPCSEDTPCTTCISVESARIWKAPCSRTKLHDSFNLWSVELFNARVQSGIPAATLGFEPEHLPGRVEARLLLGSEYCMAFAVTRFAPGLLSYREALQDPSKAHQVQQDVVLLSEGDLVAAKLQSYLSFCTDAYIAAEENSFIRNTLQQAQQMLQADTARGDAAIQSESTRSCYTVHTQLLSEVISLWVGTKVLTTESYHESTIRCNFSELPYRQPEPVVATGGDRLSRESEKLILAQLLATTEAQCRRFSKIVMSELERRLLQRQQVSRFTTFITAVILLNCIERMTGLYRSFGCGPIPTDGCGTEGYTFTDSTRWEDWPLDAHPNEFWPQGEQFSNLLIMLLRMRALPPTVKTSEEGNLMIAPVDEKKIKDQGESQTALAAQWLNSIDLRTEDLVKIRDEPLPGKDDKIDAWDLKFVLRALLPTPEPPQSKKKGRAEQEVPSGPSQQAADITSRIEAGAE